MERNCREELPEELREDWDRLLLNVDTKLRLSSVILNQDNKDKIHRFIEENTFREQIIKSGLRPMNRILMYGASGTGKTMLCKALCNHLGYTMMCIDIADALSNDDVAENISKIFQIGNILGRCLIFLDECDSIAWSRDAKSGDGGTIRRATNALFQALDQMRADNIFVSATNMIYRLDPAFERRFDLKMEFRRPDMDLYEMISHFIKDGFKLVNDSNEREYSIVKKRLGQRENLSYYEIQVITERAMKTAVINGVRTVKMSDVLADIKTTFRLSVEVD